MTYSIFDGGNLVTSIDREDEAREVVAWLATADPDVRLQLLLVAFDDTGNAIHRLRAGRAPADSRLNRPC